MPAPLNEAFPKVNPQALAPKVIAEKLDHVASSPQMSSRPELAYGSDQYCQYLVSLVLNNPKCLTILEKIFTQVRQSQSVQRKEAFSDQSQLAIKEVILYTLMALLLVFFLELFVILGKML